MVYILASLMAFSASLSYYAQVFQKPSLSGAYFQWGYSRQWYTRSDLHFSREGAYDFTVHRARATDEPEFRSLLTAPLHVTIPQNNARIGLYLNPAAAAP